MKKKLANKSIGNQSPPPTNASCGRATASAAAACTELAKQWIRGRIQPVATWDYVSTVDHS